MHLRTRTSAALLALLLAALFAGFATSASAAPPPPTLGMAGLRQKLAESPDGTVEGYFKTVLKGQTIDTIPVTILGTTAGSLPNTSLILFEATGEKMAKYGGIVAGMSGSPIYVEDGGIDKIVGAVSYGDYFTLGGTGLATPIEAMIEMSAKYPGVYSLASPVIADGKVIKRVIVSSEPEAFAGADADGALVAKPLNTVFIGGLRPGTTAYKGLSKSLAARGLDVAPIVAPLAGGTLDAASMVPTDLVPGAAVAVLSARGDLWYGGIGTVSYNEGSNVLAFGHPDAWDGTTNRYMMNAWIDGIWPSSYWPYKLGSPTVVRGTIVQDRYAGVLGHLDQPTAETTITARVTDIDTGETTTSATYIPRFLLNTGVESGYLVAGAVATSVQKLIDLYWIEGSAQTTTTITVGDGTQVYQVVMPNFFDSDEVDWEASYDSWRAISQLQSVLRTDTEHLDIQSIDFEMDYSSARRRAKVAEVNVVGGLKTGENTATVTYFVPGHSEFVTQAVPFTIPAGTPLVGSIYAGPSSGYGSNYYDYYDYYYDYYYGSSSTTSGPIEDWIYTVAEAVEDLSGGLPHNVLSVVYRPRLSKASVDASKVIETTATTPWYVTRSARLSSPRLDAYVMPSTIGYRDWAILGGLVSGPETDAVVAVYATPANSTTESLVATAAATYEPRMGVSLFGLVLEDYDVNQQLRVRCEPVDSWLSADATTTLYVKPSLRLGLSRRTLSRGQRVTLSASVLPVDNVGSQVAFQVYSGGRWKTLSTKTLTAAGSAAKASYSWKPTSKGLRKVRVKFLGSPTNAAASTSATTVRIK